MNLPLRKKPPFILDQINISESTLLSPELVKLILDKEKVKQLTHLINPDEKLKPFNIVIRGGAYSPRWPFVKEKWIARSFLELAERKQRHSNTMLRQMLYGVFNPLNKQVIIFIDTIALHSVNLNYCSDHALSHLKKSGYKQYEKEFIKVLQNETADTLIEEIMHSQQNIDDTRYSDIFMKMVPLLLLIGMSLVLIESAYPMYKDYYNYYWIFYFCFVFFTIGMQFIKHTPRFHDYFYERNPVENEVKILKKNPILQKIARSCITLSLIKPIESIMIISNSLEMAEAANLIKNKKKRNEVLQKISQMEINHLY